MKRSLRLFLVLLLVGTVGVMGVHYDATYDDRWPYPAEESLKTTPEAHDGAEVFVFGTVQAVDAGEDTATIEIDSDAGPFTARVSGFDAQVRPGGTVQVVGTFDAGGTITAGTVRVVNPAGASEWYKYAVSVIAAVLVLAVFFQHWRVNLRQLRFERR